MYVFISVIFNRFKIIFSFILQRLEFPIFKTELFPAEIKISEKGEPETGIPVIFRNGNFCRKPNKLDL